MARFDTGAQAVGRRDEGAANPRARRGAGRLARPGLI